MDPVRRKGMRPVRSVVNGDLGSNHRNGPQEPNPQKGNPNSLLVYIIALCSAREQLSGWCTGQLSASAAEFSIARDPFLP